MLAGVACPHGTPATFTTAAVVLAELFVAAPFYVQAATSALRQVDPRLLIVARTLGAPTRCGCRPRSRSTHVLSAVFGYVRGGFVVSVRASTATGTPRTEVMGSSFDVKSGRAQPIFGPHNGVRPPTYVALDLHAEYGFRVRPLQVSIFADVLKSYSTRRTTPRLRLSAHRRW